MRIPTTVISLGGSVVMPHELDSVFLSEFQRLVVSVVRKARRRIIIVVGGGSICRQYQAAARKLVNAPAKEQDYLGILTTRLNAELARILFSDLAHPKILTHPKELARVRKPIVLVGGNKPGASSDIQAVEFAHAAGTSEVINVTNIPYVYKKDPRRYKDAKPIVRMSWKEYLSMFRDPWQPGMNIPFDAVAGGRAAKYGISVAIVVGWPIVRVQQALTGEHFDGTWIVPENSLES